MMSSTELDFDDKPPTEHAPPPPPTSLNNNNHASTTTTTTTITSGGHTKPTPAARHVRDDSEEQDKVPPFSINGDGIDDGDDVGAYTNGDVCGASEAAPAGMVNSAGSGAIMINSTGMNSELCREMGQLDVDGEGEEPAESFSLVTAIDFGTTFSGYAYSLSSEIDAIFTNKNWGQTQGFMLHKTPTCLLLRPSGEFEAFGFDAVSKYNDLSEEEVDDYYYFDRFKMKLYANKVNI
ncbi:heat shock 70 kDa protein 12A-like [Octopus sinensis]|uniref:Heat shock 70 kDa protein 12A-like n=1 Tax=Octopus sinensis TaxID=2607531 RepID=A0A6P7U8C5_9MOLL|nr:heat shock 70 kDa protein 12A-like [Octopus sinensis]XP_036355935.1 heat shock 70 kDa protein 12A-like [Octopus sinensis]XP_036355936.1 heat shock 70 kDa protein 12A-like [Octopus sinensis]